MCTGCETGTSTAQWTWCRILPDIILKLPSTQWPMLKSPWEQICFTSKFCLDYMWWSCQWFNNGCLIYGQWISNTVSSSTHMHRSRPNVPLGFEQKFLLMSPRDWIQASWAINNHQYNLQKYHWTGSVISTLVSQCL